MKYKLIAAAAPLLMHCGCALADNLPAQDEAELSEDPAETDDSAQDDNDALYDVLSGRQEQEDTPEYESPFSMDFDIPEPFEYHGTESFEYLCKTFACRNGNKTVIFFFSGSCCVCLSGILEESLFMLKTHVVDLHVGERTVLQCSLDRKTGIIGMYVNLDDLVVGNKYYGITDRFKISLEIKLVLYIECLVEHDDEFGTITELDIIGLDSFSGTSLRLACGLGNGDSGEIDLLAHELVKSTVEHFHKTLSARIHYACLLEYGQEFGSLA